MNRRTITLLASAVLLVLAGCGGGGETASGPAPASVPSNPAEVSGAITVLTNRTDLDKDGTLKKYAAEFNKVYPKVEVKFQAITDYAGEVKVRMNTENYGDVLLIPPSIGLSDFPKFFSPLGTSAELSKKYSWTNTATVDDTVYGLATFGNANGFVYNKKTWKQAGVTKAPTTPGEFQAALQAVKSKTGAIPYYTNYHDGWPAQGWFSALGSATCDPAAADKLATDPAPWSDGKDLATIATVLFDAVHGKLTEPDPTTTNWENSKTLLGTGKVATMWLGSWAITQMRDAATTAKADPADIGFLPFPAQKDGKFCSVTGPDYNQAINIHSGQQQAARAWIDWFTDKSGFAGDQGSIPAQKGAELPDTFADYTDLGVSYIELSQQKAAVVKKIDGASELGITSAPDPMQKLIDVARGAAGGDLASLFGDWNKKWSEGIQNAGE